MKSLFLLVLCGLCVLGACGGSGEEVASSGTGNTAAAGSGGAGAAGPAASGSATAAGGNGGAGQGGGAGACRKALGDCKSVLLDLRAKLAQAKACDPASPVMQCQDSVQGACCPEVVADADSRETKCFLETLAEVKATTCAEACSPEPCAAPNHVCSSSMGGSPGCS